MDGTDILSDRYPSIYLTWGGPTMQGYKNSSRRYYPGHWDTQSSHHEKMTAHGALTMYRTIFKLLFKKYFSSHLKVLRFVPLMPSVSRASNCRVDITWPGIKPATFRTKNRHCYLQASELVNGVCLYTTIIIRSNVTSPVSNRE